MLRSARQQFRHGGLADRAFEKIGIHPSIERRRVGKRIVAKIFFGDQAVVDQFVSLFDHLVHVGHIPMSDIRAHHRVELCQRTVPSVEKLPIEIKLAF